MPPNSTLRTPIQAYMTSGDLWLITSQLKRTRLPQRLPEKHLCNLGPNQGATWVYMTYGPDSV
jgi:hypothetical protein